MYFRKLYWRNTGQKILDEFKTPKQEYYKKNFCVKCAKTVFNRKQCFA
jgi:hypothetical protein